jgi:peptidoglycan hydrolase-like protein with peptidoglycan-binding domain
MVRILSSKGLGCLCGFGAFGTETQKLQQAVINSGFSMPKYGADGKWGDETKSAMNKYQSSRKMAPTSKPDIMTVTTLNSESPTRGDGIVISWATLSNELKLSTPKELQPYTPGAYVAPTAPPTVQQITPVIEPPPVIEQAGLFGLPTWLVVSGVGLVLLTAWYAAKEKRGVGELSAGFKSASRYCKNGKWRAKGYRSYAKCVGAYLKWGLA